MSEHVLVGNVERFGIESDGSSHRFSTILAESYHYARLRIKELEEAVACYEAMKEGMAVRIADLEHKNAVLSLKARVVDRLPLCPDHRDKVAGKPCLQCKVEWLSKVNWYWDDRDIESPARSPADVGEYDEIGDIVELRPLHELPAVFMLRTEDGPQFFDSAEAAEAAKGSGEA
jgi:hypothetical protein